MIEYMAAAAAAFVLFQLIFVGLVIMYKKKEGREEAALNLGTVRVSAGLIESAVEVSDIMLDSPSKEAQRKSLPGALYSLEKEVLRFRRVKAR
jgi:hypothetical protein